MTLTFNLDKYKEILTKYSPKIIKTEAENEQVLEIIEELMHKKNLTPEEEELYELLIVLVEKFEREYYLSGNSTNPHSLLLFLMEQKEIKQEDLVDIIGSKKVVSDIINGERSISKDEAKALADFFGVDAELFI